MKYLKREALTARINGVVAAVTADPKTSASLGGFALRSSQAECVRAKPTDDDVERIRAALGEDAAGSRILPFIVSTDKRQGDGLALSMGGAKTERYGKNPVVLYNHSWWRMPVGHSVVWTETASDTAGSRMRALVAMMSRDLSQSLDRGFSWALGELAAARGHAASIGFDVLLAHPAPPEVRAANPWAMDVDEWELLEWSLVQIPMDADAVSEHRAAGGDVDPLATGFSRMLDELETEGVDRERIERAWAAAAGARGRVFTPPVSDDADADAVRAVLRAAWAP